jgi:cysteine desulfurase
VLAIQHGHNELGTLCDLEKLVTILRRKAPDAHVHVDLVQSYGKIDFDLDTAGVDSVAISAHKFHGPRGIGCLGVSSKARISPLQMGGGQEHGMRGGTENVAAAVGMAVAAEAALSCLSESAAICDRFATLFFEQLTTELEAPQRLGHSERRLPHVLSMRLPGIVAHSLQERMDARGVAFSTGSACHGETTENHVLAAIGLDGNAAREVMRISFSKLNTESEVKAAAELLIEEAEILKAICGGLSAGES